MGHTISTQIRAVIYSISYKIACVPFVDKPRRLIRVFSLRLRTLLTIGYPQSTLRTLWSSWAPVQYYNKWRAKLHISVAMGECQSISWGYAGRFTTLAQISPSTLEHKKDENICPRDYLSQTREKEREPERDREGDRKWRAQERESTTKTCLYNIDPLKPHFYIVKLGITEVYIIFLISAQKHKLWVPVRTASSQSMFWAEIRKISEVFIWKFSFFGGEIFIVFEFE